MATSTASKKITAAEEARIAEADAARQAEQEATEAQESAAEATPAADPKAESRLKNQLRNKAEREILDKYKDELVARTEALFDENGIKYVRRLSEDEKDEQALAALLAKNPKLAESMRAKLVPTEADAPAE